jgi:hypothetical protein
VSPDSRGAPGPGRRRWHRGPGPDALNNRVEGYALEHGVDYLTALDAVLDDDPDAATVALGVAPDSDALTNVGAGRRRPTSRPTSPSPTAISQASNA